MRKKNRITYVATGLVALGVIAGMTGCAGGSGLSAQTEDLTEKYRTGGETSDDGTVAAEDPKDDRTTAAEDKEDDGTAASEDPKDDRTAASDITTEFADAYADFSLDLLRESRAASDAADQTMVSPFSVMMALEMTRQGAAAKTREQMDAVLYPGITGEEGTAGLLAFADSLGASEETKLYLANSIWLNTANDNFVPDETFLKTEAQLYDANIYGAPFDGQTCEDINRRVADETDGMVEQVLDKIPEEAIMYLVNAVAFEAKWVSEYDESQVHDAVFYGADGSEAEISMMYEESRGYLEGAGMQGFYKPYEDGYAFVALLPDEGVSLGECLAGLDGETFRRIVTADKDVTVETGLPKFEGRTELELSDVLAGLGMPLAFDAEKADFSGMGSCRDGSNICISRVLHQTCVNVDELGTEAGAATVVEMIAETALWVDEPKRVILDRPFLYAIVEEETGLPVFIGTVDQL